MIHDWTVVAIAITAQIIVNIVWIMIAKAIKRIRRLKMNYENYPDGVVDYLITTDPVTRITQANLVIKYGKTFHLKEVDPTDARIDAINKLKSLKVEIKEDK